MSESVVFTRVFAALLRRLGVLACALALTGCITDISVARHPDVSLTDAEARQIFASFSKVVNKADSAADVACIGEVAGQSLPAFYVLDGPVQTYTGPAVINGSADFLALLQQPGYAKVVSAINWCGDFGPNIIGCAPIPGNTFVVVRHTSALEGVLWAHEFGHSTGLVHRNDAGALMRSSLGVDHRNITLAECQSLIQKFNPDYYLPGAPAAAVRSTAPVNTDSAVDGLVNEAEALPTSVVELVRRVYPHGTPMKALAAIGSTSELPALRSMLNDPEEAPYWGNIAVALGMFGDASDVARLTQFASSRAALNSPGALGDASAALMALGYLANRTGDALALQYLASRRDAAAWPVTSRRQQLAITANIGMAFAGQMPAAARASRASTPVSSSLASELQALSAEMASKGVRAYYLER